MNKVITEGLVLMPTPFVDGLGVWSSQNGTPGSNTYAEAGGGVYVPADQDFGGCMEIVKANAPQKIRYMGETPLQPGLYLEVRARVKAVAGALPGVRIAGWAGQPGGGHVGGLTEVGPTTQLTTYGQVVEVRAIIATSNRFGVDMNWNGATYGHLGIDFTGPNGGVVRIDDIEIHDVTDYFIRELMGLVDVRDYGAKGDGTTNDTAAFLAADADAQGRQVLVSKGTYKLAGDVTFVNEVRFEGTIIQAVGPHFILQKNFDYDTYIAAFDGDEELAFKKAYQALLNFADHDGLDLRGRRIALTEPLDMQALEPTKTSFATRRVIRNGQFQVSGASVWSDQVVTSQATYASSNSKTLTNVANVSNIKLGALVTGNGVGREVYVKAINVGQNKVTLSQELYDAEGTQNFTFRRFQYLLDFSGYSSLSQFILADIDFYCSGQASAVMLAQDGLLFQLRDCFFTKPKDRAITSLGGGCQGMQIDNCNFTSNEAALPVDQRVSICFNTNANDVKIRANRAAQFRHFCMIAGSGTTIVGNHWFMGDNVANGVRLGGVILTTPNSKTLITGNYIDNCFIELTNEHDATPDLGAQYPFGGLTITGNQFTAKDAMPFYSCIVVKPYGTGQFISGLSVVSNVFRALSGNIDRVERVDTTFADLDYNRMVNVNFSANVYNGVTNQVANPLSVAYTQSTAANTWTISPAAQLPFEGRVRNVDAVVHDGQVVSGGNPVYDLPYTETSIGSGGQSFRLRYSSACSGSVRCLVRMDNTI